MESLLVKTLHIETPCISPFIHLVANEKWNTEILLKYLYSDIILKTIKKEKKYTGAIIHYENERQQVEMVLKSLLKNKNSIKSVSIDKTTIETLYHNRETLLKNILQVKYKYAGSKDNSIGRVYPVGNIGYCGIRRALRHTLCDGIYLDIDLVNAHFSILNETFPGKFPVLNDYVLNRERFFNNICDYYSMPECGIDYHTKNSKDKEMCKDLFIRILYNGNFQSWLKENSLPESLPIPDFIIKLKNEFEAITKAIMEANPNLTEKVIKEKGKNGNYKGSILSWFSQEKERKILEIIYEFLKLKKLINKKHVVLCFDGLQILCNSKLSTINQQNLLLEECENEIKLKSGYNLKLKIKQFDEKLEDNLLNFNIPEPPASVISEEVEDYTDSYENIKNEFEQQHCKIINKSIFIKECENTNIILSKSQLMTSYEHLSFEKVKTTEFGTYVTIENFITKWLYNNDSQRKYDDIGVYPSDIIYKCPTNIFNMWKPFKMESVSNYEPNEEGKNKLLKHISILCNHEEEVYSYFIQWIGQMIKYPSKKSVCITLISKQGAGKGTFLKLMSLMLGQDKVFETANPSRDVWGNFNGRMANSFLINLNELSKKETIECEGRIKALITDPTLTINNKGINQYEVPSFHRFIATTNSPEPFNTSSDDRRNCMVRSSDEKCNDKEYFNDLNKLLDDINVIKTCYEYFKSLPDLDKFGTLCIPKTNYQENLKELAKTPIEQWLEHFTITNQNESVLELLGSETCYLFKSWCSENFIKYEIDPKKLGVRIINLNIDGISKGRHTNKGSTKYFDITKLKKYFSIGLLIDANKIIYKPKELLLLEKSDESDE